MNTDYTKPIGTISTVLMYDPLEKLISVSFSSSDTNQIRELLQATGRRCLFKLDHVTAPNETGERTVTIQLIPV